MMKKGLLAILVLVTMGVTALFCFMYIAEDRQGPVISVPDESVTYKDGDNEEILLEGVTARDKRDGDVTDSLRIEKIQTDEDGAKVIVTYVAKDSKNNITKVKRIINNASGESGSNEDDADVDETADEETVQEQMDVQSAGEAANEEAIAALPDGAPRFYLTDYELNVALGAEFYALDYVRDIVDDMDSIDTLSTQIQLEGEVNTAVPGTYQLVYYVVDSDLNVSNRAVLTVTVE